MRGHVGVGYGGRKLSEELYGVFQSEVVGGDIVFFGLCVGFVGSARAIGGLVVCKFMCDVSNFGLGVWRFLVGFFFLASR